MKKITRDAFSYVEYEGKTAPPERCSTCFYGTFPGSKCSLYEAINGLMPEAWNLEETVNPNGACNAFTDKPVEKALIQKDPIYILNATGGR